MASDLGLTFHHVGYATRDLASDREFYFNLGFSKDGEEFVDPVQGIRGQFLVKEGYRLELLEPHNNATTLDGFLKKGTKLYHQAFTTPHLERSVEGLRGAGGLVIAGPVSAVAFSMRKICFLMMPNRDVIELIEA